MQAVRQSVNIRQIRLKWKEEVSRRRKVRKTLKGAPEGVATPSELQMLADRLRELGEDSSIDEEWLRV